MGTLDIGWAIRGLKLGKKVHRRGWRDKRKFLWFKPPVQIQADWCYIQDWCYIHLGFVPEITHEKDHLMLNLFDDRVVQVEPNTGRILGRMPLELGKYEED